MYFCNWKMRAGPSAAATVVILLLLCSYGTWNHFNSKLIVMEKCNRTSGSFSSEDSKGSRWVAISDSNLQTCKNIERSTRSKRTATSDDIKNWQNLKCLSALKSFYIMWSVYLRKPVDAIYWSHARDKIWNRYIHKVANMYAGLMPQKTTHWLAKNSMKLENPKNPFRWELCLCDAVNRFFLSYQMSV